MTERIEIERAIPAPAAEIFAVLCDPQGHVAIDSTGMLQDADGDPVRGVGDSFVVHMDRESLNDYPQLGKYDITVDIKEFEQDQLISWTVLGQPRPTTALPPSSPRSTTGRTSTRSGATPGFSRCCRRARCGPPWAFSTARSGAVIPGAEPGIH